MTRDFFNITRAIIPLLPQKKIKWGTNKVRKHKLNFKTQN